MKSDIVINIKPHSIDYSVDSNGNFVLIFKTWTEKPPQKRKIVKIHLKFWWIKLIAKMMYEIIQKRKDETDRVEEALKNDR